MRLWSVHPRYFDRQALTACWREALLAQSVLAKPAGGYSNHPQLERFRAQAEPAAAVASYLAGIADEADSRGYRFDRGKINRQPQPGPLIPVTSGQLGYEWSHLLAKLNTRSPDVARRWVDEASPAPHPLFTTIPGPVSSWERVQE
ncbi:pyrimidine dimer DNA glycosylase/endonuclease V [Saxibacter everestensis]|uniref:Pyrimidine dimer DNA glycosylase/endonuclease V n=1 Tax=Saxibacter everestensis TaxID=2909229 RepID=A0ABY8QT67_9MICO|nr:pyrimidine dimer DNA glycosylase/endonuclease V [Brevibacteriaceae bacterium ZFBP1038]